MRTLIFLLALSVFGYFWHYRRERWIDYDALKSSVKTTENDIAQREKEIVLVEGRLKPLKENEKTHAAPDTSPELLEKEIEELKAWIKNGTAELDAAEADFLAAVESAREKGKKENFPVVKLASGQELKDATITKFGEGFLSISHSDGISRVQAEDLPEAWVERFALDYVPRDSKAERDVVAFRAEKATTAPLDLAKAKLAEIEARLADVDAQLMQMSTGMRDSRRTEENLIRDAWKLQMEKGDKGKVVAAKRKAMFDQSSKEKANREETRKKYVALRAEKLELEKKKLDLKKRP